MYIKGYSQKIEKQPGRWEKLFANHVSNIGLISKIYKEFLEFSGSFPGSSVSKESACNAGDQGLILGLGRSPRDGNGNPLQYSCLENPVDRGAWWASVHGVAQSWTWLKRLSVHACIGERNGNPLQCSCLENPRDRGAWWAAIYGVAQSQTWLKRHSSSSQFSSWKILWPQEPGGLQSIGSQESDTTGRLNHQNSTTKIWFNSKMGKRLEWIFLQRRYTNGR